VDDRLNMSSQGETVAQRGKYHTGMWSRITCKTTEVIIPLYTALARLLLEKCDQFWATQYKEDGNKIERIQ